MGKKGKQIVNTIKSLNYKLLISIMVLVTVVGCFTSYRDTKNNQSMSLTLTYSGSEKGLNPDGSVFNMSEIVSDEVIDSAVKKLNKDGIDITNEELQEGLHVSSNIPDTALDSAKAAINANETYQNITNTFKISYSSDNFLPDYSVLKVLTAVKESYEEYFEKYHTEKTTILEYEKVDINDYDYIEVADVITRKLTSMKSYLNEKNSTDNTFVSETTGYSFSDLVEMLTNVSNLDLDSFKSTVKENNLSTDSTSLYNKFVTLQFMKEQDYEDTKNKQDVTEDAVNNYDGEITASVFIPSYDDDDNYYMSKTKTGADYLVENAYKYSTTATSLISSIKEYNSLMKSFDGSSGDTTKADKLISEINSEMSDISELAIQTSKDYIEKSTKGYLSFSIPEKASFNFKSIVKYLGLGFVIGFLVSLVIYLYNLHKPRFCSVENDINGDGIFRKKLTDNVKKSGVFTNKDIVDKNLKNTVNNKNDSITVWMIFEWIWKWKMLIIVSSLLFSYLGYSYANHIQTYSATAYIKFEDQAVAEGMTPDYDDFDKDEIVTTSIISSAIDDIGLNGYSVDSIKNNIKVSSITPTYISTIKDTKTEAGEEYEYYPIYYSVSITNGGNLKGMSASQLRNLLDAILNEYMNTYTTDYINKATIESISFDSDKYDYLESADLLSDNLKSIMESLSGYTEADSNYRSPTTGYTFSDLSVMYENIETIDLPRLYSSIYNNKLAKDADLLIDTYKNSSKSNKLLSDSYSTQMEEDKRLIDELVKTSKNITNATTSGDSEDDVNNNQVINDVENRTKENHTPLITYDDLLNKCVDDGINQGQATLDSNRDNDIVELYSGESDLIDLYKKDSVSTEEVEESIDDILEQVNELYKVASMTLNDYNNYIAPQHITFVTGVATYANVSRLMYMMILGALAFMFSTVGVLTYEVVKMMRGKNHEEDVNSKQ